MSNGGGTSSDLHPIELSPAHEILIGQRATQDSIALAFAELYQGRFAYVYPSGWLQWTGKLWSPDISGDIREEIRKLARRHNRDGLSQLAAASFVNGVLEFLKSDPAMKISAFEFDRDAHLLNCFDGVWHLGTGERYDHSPELKITKITPISVGHDEPKVFLKFLDEITGGDKELQAFFQIMLGSLLTGAQEIHKIFYWYGATSRNGKSTLAELIRYILGDYATTFPAEALTKGETRSNDFVQLVGKRLAISGEVPDGCRWHEGRIKTLTSDEYIDVKPHYKETYSVKRTHKHLVLGNYRPAFNSMDAGTTSKFVLVPFNVSFLGREDVDLPMKLRKEAPDILGWLMQGHLQFILNGMKLPTCKAVDEATRDYFESQSTVNMWIEERCERIDNRELPKSHWAKSSELYADYADWKRERGEAPLGESKFSESLQVEFKKARSNGMRFAGLRLSPLPSI